jgi:hypothetical protein
VRDNGGDILAPATSTYLRPLLPLPCLDHTDPTQILNNPTSISPLQNQALIASPLFSHPHHLPLTPKTNHTMSTTTHLTRRANIFSTTGMTTEQKKLVTGLWLTIAGLVLLIVGFIVIKMRARKRAREGAAAAAAHGGGHGHA